MKQVATDLANPWAFVRANPVPFFAFAGLLAGLILRFGLHQPGGARWVWLATLLGGGTPPPWRRRRWG